MGDTCQMVVNWTTNSDGEPDQEIYCTRPATRIHERSVLCCEECAALLVREGFVMPPLHERPVHQGCDT